LLGVSLGAVVLVSALTIPVVWFGRRPIVRWLNAPGLGPYLWLVPLAVFVGGVFLALNYWNSRTKHFGRLSVARVIKSVATFGTQLGVGYAGYATGGSLIGADVIGRVVSVLVLGGQIWRDDHHTLRQSVNRHDMVASLKRHHKFPLYTVWAALLNNMSWQLPTFLLSAFFSSAVTGYYDLGNRVVRLPMNLIGGSIAQVFFQRASAAKHDGTLALVVESTFRRLVSLSMFPLLVLAIVGPDVFALVFGARWLEAGVYSQILAIWTFFWFLSSPVSTLFSVLERQGWSLRLNAAIFVTRFLSLGIGGYLESARLALVLFAASGILVYGYLSFVIMAASGVSQWSMIRLVLLQFGRFLPVAMLLLLLKYFGVHSLVIMSASCVALAAHYFYVVMNDPQLRRILGRLGLPV
jgi:O-antigen/teichoic acid export membrane protein